VSGYVRNIVVKKDYEGDKVTITLNPIGFGDALKLKGLDPKTLSETDFIPLMEILKGYVVALSGLKADDASDISVEELFSKAYFVGLLTEVLEEWLKKGTPKDPS
jgi:hypothetical protein